MKKLLLSALLVFTAVSIANAEPRFGVVGYLGGDLVGSALLENGSGIAVSDDMYTAALLLGSTSDSESDKSLTSIGLDLKYKMALTSDINGTAGIRYVTVSGDVEKDKELKDASVLALTVGIEKAFASNVYFVGDLDVYQSVNAEYGTMKVKETGILAGGKAGVMYLF